MELTDVGSTSSWRLNNDRRDVSSAEQQLESMVYRLTQERGRWPFLTPRLENVTDKAKDITPPLIKKVWDFMQNKLEQAERKGMEDVRYLRKRDDHQRFL